LAKDVIMPALGMAQETGVLLQWLKAPGETVTKGEPLMEVETDKATVEIEAPASGVLAQVTAGPGDEIPVGQVIAVILGPQEKSSPARSQTDPSASLRTGFGNETQVSAVTSPAEIRPSPLAARLAAEHNLDLRQVKPAGGRVQKEDVLAYLETQGKQTEVSKTSKVSVGDGDGRIPASPKARRLAAEHGLELATIKGSGPAGAVLAADVLAVATAPALPPEPVAAPAATLQTLTTSRAWRVAAERVTQSWTTVPHFYLIREVNAGQLIMWREKAQQRITEKLTYTDLLVKVVAAALRRHPRLNAMWHEGRIVLNEQVNIGLAVAVEEGLVVPVIHQADQLGLGQLAARRKELVARSETNKLSPDDISGGTFTISNLGMYGVDAFNAIVNPPQAAILAVSRIADRVVPVNGQPAVQPMLTLSLSCDHRVVDGARGAQFLQTLAELVEEPMRLLD